MKSINVVIVDDEPSIITSLTSNIDWTLLNIETKTAGSGFEALDIIKNNSIDILITDVRMPEMDGLTLIEEATKINQDIKCIIISAHDEFDYVKKALQFGVENYLLKPINYNELYYSLEKTITNIEQSNILKPSSNDLSSDTLAFKFNILNRWITGTIEDFELIERSKLIDIDLTLSKYRIAVITHRNITDSVEKFNHSSSIMEYLRKRFGVSKEISLLIDSNSNICIIIYGSNSTSIYKELSQAVAELQSSNKDNESILISFGINVNSYKDLHHSYHYAKLGLYYSYIYTKTYKSDFFVNTTTDSIMKLQDEFVQDIINALNEENYSYIKRKIDDYYSQNQELPITQVRSKIILLALNVVHNVIITGKLKGTIPDNFKKQLSEYGNARDLKSLKNWIMEVVGNAINIISERKGTYHLLVRKTFELINNQYKEPISLKTIANILNVTPAYLGQLFRTETGSLFNDYLNSIRLEKAKELLQNSDMKVSQIINEIGISSQSYFNRLFKKIYSVSPVEYRRNSK